MMADLAEKVDVVQDEANTMTERGTQREEQACFLDTFVPDMGCPTDAALREL